MSDVKLNFYPKDSTGRNPGDYEMFIDFDSSVGRSSMVLEAPAGRVMPNLQKNSDKRSLANGDITNYDAVFNNVVLPAGFSFDPANSTLSSTGATDGLFEFLVWIQDGSGDNDYLDPGIRNHGLLVD